MADFNFESDMRPVYDMFVKLVGAGFNEDQALKIIVFFMFYMGMSPRPMGSASG